MTNGKYFLMDFELDTNPGTGKKVCGGGGWWWWWVVVVA